MSKLTKMSNIKFRKSIHSEVHIAIREELIKQRMNLGLSQRELADKLNVTRSLIGKIETGDRRLDFVEMIEYCASLELDSKYLLGLVSKLAK